MIPRCSQLDLDTTRIRLSGIGDVWGRRAAERGARCRLEKQNAPDSIESRDAPSISPPPKTALTHSTFWRASEQRPVVTGFWLPKADPAQAANCVKGRELKRGQKP